MSATRKRKKHPGGRPPLPPGEARTERLTLLLTPNERDAVEAAAKRVGLRVPEFARRRVLDTLKRPGAERDDG